MNHTRVSVGVRCNCRNEATNSWLCIRSQEISQATRLHIIRHMDEDGGKSWPKVAYWASEMFIFVLYGN
jgi:hypothetical protein